MIFRLIFSSNRGEVGRQDSQLKNVFGLGPGWSTPWRSYVRSSSQPAEYFVVDGYGKAQLYVNNSASTSSPNYNKHDGSWLETWTSGPESGYVVYHMDGGRDIYATQVIDASATGSDIKFLTRRENATGGSISFAYDDVDAYAGNAQLRLRTVTDAGGDSVSLTYTNVGAFGSLISSVTSPFGATAVMTYDANGYLTDIKDVVGLTSTIGYNPSDSNQVSSVVTPYGTNKFEYLTFSDTNYFALHAIEKNVRHHLWVFGNLPSNPWTGLIEAFSDFTNYLAYASTLPGGTAFGLTKLDDFSGRYATDVNAYSDRNSSYWGPRQFQNLTPSVRTSVSNGNFAVTSLSTNDYNLGQLVRWRRGNGHFISDAKSYERTSGPSATEAGPITFYDYKTDGTHAGAAKAGLWNQPTIVATSTRGSDVYGSGGKLWQLRSIDYNPAGYPVETVSVQREAISDPPGGAGTTRGRTPHKPVTATQSTTRYYPVLMFDEFCDLNPTFLVCRRKTFDTGGGRGNQYFTITNGLGQSASYLYDVVTQKKTNHVSIAGWSKDYILNDVGQVTNVTWRSSDGTGLATNSYTYLNNRLRTITDPRGFTRTFDFDFLGRLTKIAFSDGTSISNRYDKLDLVERVDRLGFHQRWVYDSFRSVSFYTNALNKVTQFQYCDCGSLDSVTDALNNTTTYTRDNRGRVTHIGLPGGTYQDRKYNELDMLTNVVLSGTSEIKFDRNLQGQMTASWTKVSGNWMCFEQRSYDAFSRRVQGTNANGVSSAMAYDELGRLAMLTDSNTTSVLYGYNNFGLSEVTNQLGNITHYSYDGAGRQATITSAIGGVVQLGYSPAGDLTYLTNENNAITQWIYDAEGRVVRKLDHNGKTNFVLAYNANGWLTNRSQPPLSGSAFSSTGYAYDAQGNLTNIVYPNSATYRLSYDGLNRLVSMTDSVGTTALAYQPFGALASEDGPWATDTVSYRYDTNRALAGMDVSLPAGGTWTQQFVRDEAGRLDKTLSPVGTFDYDYTAIPGASSTFLGSLIRKIDLPGGGVRTNTYDGLGRLLSTAALFGSTNLDSHAYLYDGNNRTTRQTRDANEFKNGSYVAFSYDNVDQLTAANANELGSGASRVNEQFGYIYDPAGNLTNRTLGSGAGNQLVEAFKTDSLNQLTNITRNAAFTVAGRTGTNATSVTVKQNAGSAAAATVYGDGSFAKQGITLTGTDTFVATATDALGRSAAQTITTTLPAAVTPSYDARGNMKGDGKRTFNYDEDNQLTEVYETNKWRSTFSYDAAMRRRVRKEYTWSSAWVQTNEVRYVYVGSVVLQERTALNLPSVTYTRGSDLSGGLQEAGGIGGLLARTDHAAGQSVMYHSDARGDVTSLSYGNVVWARYQYDPYGNLIGAVGPYAEVNLYRFSSKEAHPVSGLIYYGYRFYDPNLQRWVNRDPIEERGGINLYGFVANGPTQWVDPDGLTAADSWLGQVMQGIYDAMMGEGPNTSDKDGYGRLRGDELGGVDSHDNLLRDIAGGVGDLAEEAAREAAKNAASGAVGGTLKICKVAAKAAKNPPLSAYKRALGKVHGEVGGLPKGTPGKFGSPQAGNSTKGYRLDPPHPRAARGSPESKPHINWWDWTEGARGNGGRKGAVPIE